MEVHCFSKNACSCLVYLPFFSLKKEVFVLTSCRRRGLEVPQPILKPTLLLLREDNRVCHDPRNNHTLRRNRLSDTLLQTTFLCEQHT